MLKLRLATAVLGVALLAAGPGFADDTTAASNTNDGNQIVCKSMAPPTGTRLGARRICQTQKQWDAQMKQDQKALSQQQVQTGYNSGGH
jgi:hypothetical protein